MAVPPSLPSTATSATISPSTMPLISPAALLQAYLSQSPPVRPSNRSPRQTRPINLNTSSLTHCNGSSLARVGESTIVCGIRAEILPVSDIAHYRASKAARSSKHHATQDDQEEENYEVLTLNNLLVPNLELGTGCHSSFPANVAPSLTAQSISQRILSLLHTSRLVRLADLEIRYTSDAPVTTEIDPDDPAYVEPEKEVLKAYWSLYIDCVCLSYGGETNVYDATVLAVIAALRDVRLPQAKWDEDLNQILCDADFSNATKLTLRRVPCPLGFAVFSPDSRLTYTSQAQPNGPIPSTSRNKQTSVLLLDTDAFEDDVCEEKGNVVVDYSTGECQVLRIEKVGGAGSLSAKDVGEVIKAAEKRWKEWQKILSERARPD